MDVTVRFAPKAGLWGIVWIGACATAYHAFSDTLVMTAFYPAPTAYYYLLQSTQTTYLNYCPSSQNPCTPNPVVVGDPLPPQPLTSPSYSAYAPYALYIDAKGLLGLNGTTLTVKNILSGSPLRMGLIPNGTLCDSSHPQNAGLFGFYAGSAQFCNGSSWQNL